MMNLKLSCRYILFLFISVFTVSASIAQLGSPSRKDISLSDNWRFHFAFDVRKNAPIKTLSIPHTWNAQETLDGVMNYTRDMGIYERDIQAGISNKRIFIYFEGVNSYAQVLINNKYVGEHKGGYTAFCFEITAFLRNDSINKLTVLVSNAARPDILPQTGDFNVYGGIHRPVHLIVTEQDCISPLQYASSGVYVSSKVLSQESAQVNIKTLLSITSKVEGQIIKSTIKDKSGKLVAQSTANISSDKRIALSQLEIKNPHFWDGDRDPYLYTVTCQLVRGNNVIDEIMQPLGLRTYRVSVDSGLILNGRYMDLHGFGLHEDVAGKGSAMSSTDLQTDMSLVNESGANTLRLTHYPHSSYVYNFADTNGIVLWSEIPLVGPGGYTGAGYYANPNLEANAKQMLMEMIHQNYNHPSVLFWGLFNELKLDYDDPIPFLMELDSICKVEDPNRLTTCATFLANNTFNKVSDLIAWNQYFGWYGGKFEDVATWADKTHKDFPNKAFALSEYGAGGGVNMHDEGVVKPDPGGHFHPEEWQTAFHEAHWKYLKERPFVWGKYIWDFADFGSSIRTEGEKNAMNDKGLITYDRKIKKDAFYFYKANWNSEPMLYISSRRFTHRKQSKVAVKIFSNVDKVTLVVNEKKISTQSPNTMKTILWQDVQLQNGKNIVEIFANTKTGILKDSCEWYVD